MGARRQDWTARENGGWIRGAELRWRKLCLHSLDGRGKRHPVDDAIDAWYAADNAQHFLALRLVGYVPANPGDAVAADDIEVIVPQLAVLTQLLGNGVSGALVGVDECFGQ
jgi:hypothetical protein